MPFKELIIEKPTDPAEIFAESLVGYPTRAISSALSIPRGATEMVAHGFDWATGGETPGTQLLRYLSSFLPTQETALQSAVPQIFDFPMRGRVGNSPAERFWERVGGGALGLGVGAAAQGGHALLNLSMQHLPGVLAGEALGSSVESMGGGPLAQMIAQGAGIGLTPALWRSGKKVLTQAPEATSTIAKKTFESTVPLAKEFGKIAKSENIAEVQAGRSAAREAEQLAKQQAREAEQLRKQVERFNADQIKERSLSDAARLAERKQLAKQVDKFAHENAAIMSREDFKRFRRDILQGEGKIDIGVMRKAESKAYDRLSTLSEEAKRLGTTEEAIIEKLGAGPTGLKEHVKSLYEQHKASIPEDLTTSAHKFERFADTIEKEMSEGIPTGTKELPGSKEWTSKVVSDIRSKIKDGKIRVRDVVSIDKDLSELFRRREKAGGGLQNFEKYSTRFKTLTHETLEQAAKENPKIAHAKYMKAKRIHGELQKAGQVLTPTMEWLNSVEQPGRFRRAYELFADPLRIAKQSPEVRKYVGGVIKNVLRKNFTAAERNALLLDDALGRSEPTKEAKPVPTGIESIWGKIKASPGKFKEVKFA